MSRNYHLWQSVSPFCLIFSHLMKIFWISKHFYCLLNRTITYHLVVIMLLQQKPISPHSMGGFWRNWRKWNRSKNGKRNGSYCNPWQEYRNLYFSRYMHWIFYQHYLDNNKTLCKLFVVQGCHCREGTIQQYA